MAGAHRSLFHGPDTFEVSAAVTGGQLVEADPDNAGKIRPASANSAAVLGVALADALPADTTNPATEGGPLSFAVARPEVGVAYAPTDVDVTFSGAAQFGDRLVATANGQVAEFANAAAGAAGNAHLIVGICTSPSVAAGAVGRMRLV